MSQSGDDYAPSHENPSPPGTAHDAEPADPSPTAFDATARRERPLAPADVKLDRLPEPFVEAGEVLTVGEAAETYLRVQRSNWNDETLTSKYERHLSETYPRILEADRHFQAKYDGLTTAMLTRRLSPLDDTGGWLTPWECNEMLHGGNVHCSVREALRYRLGGYEYEWIAVTAPTRSAGTPHEHIYLWIEDPDDAVGVDDLAPAFDKHLKYCATAYEEHHRYRTDGSDGAITVRPDVEYAELTPESFSTIREKSATYEDSGDVLPPTRGAQYLASQLAHLPVGDYYAEDRADPPAALFEGAALAWASPRDWLRAGQGVPG